MTCSISITGVDLSTGAAGSTGQCSVLNFATGAFTILSIPSGQSSVTSSQVYEAGMYLIAGSATVGGVAYAGTAGVQTISSADISLSIALTPSSG